MVDAYHIIGEDLQLDADNDLALVSEVDETNQRILRRLLTAKGGYIWHPTFGAGLQRYVGAPLSLENINQIKSDEKAELFQDAAVAKSPAPELEFKTTSNGFLNSIRYHNLDIDSLETLSFEVNA